MTSKRGLLTRRARVAAMTAAVALAASCGPSANDRRIPLRVGAMPVDLTTGLPTDVTPTVTLSAKPRPDSVVSNELRDTVRAAIRLVTYPEGSDISFTTEITTDADDTLVTFTLHPSTLTERWYAVRLPPFDGTEVRPGGGPQAIEARFHPGSAPRVQRMLYCVSHATTRLSIYFSEAVSLTRDVGAVFTFRQSGAAVTCANIGVPVAGISGDFDFDCPIDTTAPLDLGISAGLVANAGGDVPASAVHLDFAAATATAPGCGELVATF